MNAIRLKIKDLAEHQKPDASWVELAALLEQVKDEKLYKEWGFKNFSDYCSEELFFGKSVASDMLQGRAFIEEHFPELISVKTEKIPGYNEIALLRRAKKKNIAEKDFEELKDDLFSKGIKRDKLKAKIASLLPAKKRINGPINALKEQIRKLESKIQDLEEELEFFKQYNGFNEFNKDYLKGLRRKIMRHVHPDRGGDTGVAQEVNNFFDQVIN